MTAATRTLAPALLLSATLLAGCGAARAPGEATPPPTGGANGEREPAAATSPAGTAAPAGAEAPEEEAAPRRPWLTPGVEWSPSPPSEGEAVGIRLLQPRGGRRPLGVRGQLEGRTIYFGPAEGGWFGIGALPIGSAGPAELVLRYDIGADSTVVDRVVLHVDERDFPSVTLRVARRFVRPPPEARERIREDRYLLRTALASITPRWLAAGAFERPREERVTSPFGQERVFNGELQSRHTGVDIEGRRGDPVRASGRGVVALVRHLYYAGRTVLLDHGLGVFTGYSHLSEVEVAEGQVVEKGEIVGRVGSTGRVTGPHLHWSLYVAGETLEASSLLRLRVPSPPR